jgi:hypothetical protein
MFSKMNAPLIFYIMDDKGGINGMRMPIDSIAYFIVNIHVARNIYELIERLQSHNKYLSFTFLKVHHCIRNKKPMSCTSSGTYTSCLKLASICVGCIDCMIITARGFL